MVKRIFRALGRRFTEAGLLDEPDDLFSLTVEEVEAQIRGTAVDRDLRAIVARRRADYERFAATEPASRVTTGRLVYTESFEGIVADSDELSPDGLLTGSGCSPGRVRGRARVIRSPGQDLTIDGEILIAPMTDPAWVFLMVAAGGLVVEKGSLLSHTAIIGRELGIPTIVGVEGAMRRIPDGAEIEIDGRAGTVRISSPQGPEIDRA
jgi:pyruvate,water dikinase